MDEHAEGTLRHVGIESCVVASARPSDQSVLGSKKEISFQFRNRGWTRNQSSLRNKVCWSTKTVDKSFLVLSRSLVLWL